MNEIAVHRGGAVAQSQPGGRMAVADIISHVAMVQEVMRAVMKPEVHYGVIPGTDKPTLYKQGAEVLCMAFRVADSYQVEDLSTADVVRYRVTCTGVHQATGLVLGTGMGEASSGEEKYKWRKAYEPEFLEAPVNMRRKKTGFNKAKKESYSTFQVRTEPADLANTILKMANKRAKIAMTINVTACGDMFGQDLEDMDEALRDHLTRHGGDGAPAAEQKPPTLPELSAEKFATLLPEWRAAIAAGKAKAEQVIAKAKTKYVLSADQEGEIRKPIAPPAEPAADATTGEAASEALPSMVYADVADRLTAATTKEELDAAAALIPRVTDAAFREELTTMHAELAGGVTQ